MTTWCFQLHLEPAGRKWRNCASINHWDPDGVWEIKLKWNLEPAHILNEFRKGCFAASERNNLLLWKEIFTKCVRVKIGAPNRPQWPSPPWPPIWTIPRRRTCFHTCISGTSLQRHNSNGYQEISEISHQKVSPKLGNDGVDALGSRAQLLALEPLASKID